MDYCYQCRRHLNGALACAGCGTPAEELRQRAPVPPGPHQDITPGQDGSGEREHEEFELVPERENASGHRRHRHGSSPRRRARGRGGRKTALVSLGVVIAAGLLGLAQLAGGQRGDGGASSVKEDTSVNADGGPPPTQAPAEPAAPTVTPTVHAAAGGSRGPVGAAAPGASKSPKNTPSSPPAGHSGDNPPVKRARLVSDQHTLTSPPPTRGATTTATPTVSGSASGTHAPEPSHTKCVRFLFWCA